MIDKEMVVMIVVAIVASVIIGVLNIAFYTFVGAKVLQWMGVL